MPGQIQETESHIARFISTAHHQVIQAAPKIIIGVIVFLLIWLIALIIKYTMRHFSKRSQNKGRAYLTKLFSEIVYVTILLMGAITALGTMGINVLALVTGLGLAGFALGFALKDVLSNLLAGFIVLFFHPFRIDDIISVDDAKGQVYSINLRYTKLRGDGKRFLIPNSVVITKTVTVDESNQSVSS